MAKQEPTLAYTVHHQGRKYRAGLTADEVGDVAGEFGDHVWVDGNAPAKTSKSTGTDGGSQLGTPPVPPPSALPTPDTGTGDTEPDTGAADASAATARRSGNGTRRG